MPSCVVVSSRPTSHGGPVKAACNNLTITMITTSNQHTTMDSQAAGNNRPLYPKIDHYWFKVAYTYEPLALQVMRIADSGPIGAFGFNKNHSGSQF